MSVLTFVLAVVATLAIVTTIVSLTQVIVAAILDGDWERMKTHMIIGNLAFALYLVIATALNTWRTAQ